MPERIAEMLDFKTILLIIALGGTNALQYLGIAAPAQTQTAETVAAAEIVGTELQQCMKDLKECYRECR